MPKSLNTLSHLRRPSLLIRAARHGVTDYDRAKRLDHVLPSETPLKGEQVLDALLTAEAEIEEHRRAGLATYSITRHIDLLIALMGEARYLSRAA